MATRVNLANAAAEAAVEQSAQRQSEMLNLYQSAIRADARAEMVERVTEERLSVVQKY